MYKKRQVIFLKGTEEAKKGEIVKGIDKITIANVDPIIVRPFYIYILSDDPIKEGDWCYMTDVDARSNGIIIFKVHKIGKSITAKNISGGSFETHINFCKKIIATNDPGLNKGWIRDDDPQREFPERVMITTMSGVPKLSNSFIERFIHRYNIKHPITDIMVEYKYITTNEDWSKRPVELSGYYSLIVNSDNVINTEEEKHNWSRDEVIEIARQSFNQGETNEGCTASYKSFEDLMEELMGVIK